MFEACELGRTVSRKEYDAEEPELKTRLLELQRALTAQNIPVVIIVAGVEGAGKGEVVNLLNKWFDNRNIQTHAFWENSGVETERPRYWRFWQALPARGSMAIMFGSWYSAPIVDRVFKRLRGGDFEKEMHRVVEFEHLLIDDGALIIKFWFHLSRDEQQKRLQKDIKTNRISSPILKKYAKRYERFTRICERALRITDTGPSPWHLVEAADKRYRNLAVGRVLKDAMARRLARHEPNVTLSSVETAPLQAETDITVLDHVDLTRTISQEDYNRELTRHGRRLNKLAWAAWREKRHTVCVFEGWDAGGKGGAIRRLTGAIDARLYRVISVAAPTDEESAHHYLWRFWRHIPRAGHAIIYDRSWYGRVLVERVEGFAADREWMRSYQEINDFEEQLVDHGAVLCKFWLHISQEEQLRRFREREQTPWKKHKITEEDWRNRERWDSYRLAVNDMVARTSTEFAPWTLVPGDDKRLARVEVLKTVTDRLEQALD